MSDIDTLTALLEEARACVESEAAMADALDRHQIYPFGSSEEAEVSELADRLYDLLRRIDLALGKEIQDERQLRLL